MKKYKIQSLKINTILNVISTSSTALMTVITVPYISRVLTVAGNGAVSYAQSVAGWFLTFCVPGIALYGVRECARIRDDERQLSQLVAELLVIITFFTALTSVFFAFCIILFPVFSQNAPLMWVFLIGNVLNAYGVEWFYQSVEQYKYITIRTIIFKILSLVCIFAFVRSEDDYLIYGFLIAILGASNNIFNILKLRRMLDFHLVQHLNLRQHFRPLTKFAITKLSSTALTSLDTVLLGLFTVGTYQVGLYQFTMKCKNLFNTAIQALTSAMIPRISYEESRGNADRRIDIWKKAVVIVFDATFALCIFISIYSESIISFVVSDRYRDASTPLRIMAILLVVMALNYIMGELMLIPMKREDITTRANVIGAVVSIFAGCVLDPRFGAVGAAFSVLIAEVIIFIILLYSVREYIRQIHCFWNCVKTVTATFLAAVISVICNVHFIPNGWNAFYVLCSSLLSFWIILFLLLLIVKEKGVMMFINIIISNNISSLNK